MTVKLGTNLLSLGVQSRFNKADEVVSTTSQRLSSGLRINKGIDDAAGLAISSSLNVKTKVFSQGVRNLNDGLSAINITEAAIDGLSNILSRIEELSMQSLNGANSDNQRAVMQQEVTALQAEWNRIVESTTFNGKQLLTGTDTRLVLQGGSGAQGAVAMQIGKEALAGGFENSAGETTRINTSSGGAQGDDQSYAPVISADGRFVAFESYASNLVTGDTNGASLDIFVKDTRTGSITRVTTDSAGGESNDGSGQASISADGRYVAFASGASNLVAGDTNDAFDIFIKDTVTGTTTRVNTDSSGNQTEQYAYSGNPVISADGRYVAFVSYASNLVAGDVNGTYDIFIKDTVTGTTTALGADVTVAGGAMDPVQHALSADGRYIVFYSEDSSLVPNDTNGSGDFFWRDLKTGQTIRVNSSSTGGESNEGNATGVPSISADGRYVTFASYGSNLVEGDTNSSLDIFVKDTATGVTTRVSTSSEGVQSDNLSNSPTISADGRYVAFLSDASNLVAGDTNGVGDVFVKDTLTGVTTRVGVSSAGIQGNWWPEFIPSISADGRFVAFNSGASNVVAGDTNGWNDVFLRDLTKAGIQSLAGMVVSNQASAKVTLALVDKYKSELFDYRAKLGASTSRVISFLSTLQSDQLSYAAASSRITDADVASESATLVAATTRRQVASSLLTQANLIPEIALELLRRL